MGGDRRVRSAAAALGILVSAACGGDDPAATPAIDVCVAGRWVSHGGTMSNQRHGCQETALTPDTVTGLEEKWRITPGSTVGTPAVYDGVVYFGSMDRQIHAVNAETGSDVWATPIEGGVQSSVAVSEDSVYVVDIGPSGRILDSAPTPPQVYRLDRATGDILAQVPYDVHPLSVGWSSPVYVPGDNVVIVGVASFEVFFVRGERSFHGKVLILDGDTLAVRHIVEVNAPEYGPGVSIWSSPAVDTDLGLVFIGSGQGYEDPVTPLSDSLLAINYKTGQHAWHQQYTANDKYVLRGPDNGPDYDVGAPPNLFNLADGTPAVGVGDKEGTYHVHDRRDGALIWEEKISAGSSLGGVMQSGAYYDGELFVVSNKAAGEDPSLFALDAEDGHLLWDVDLGDSEVFGAITVVNGVIYLGDMGGTVHVRSATDGSVIWTDPHVPATSSAQADAEAIAAGISLVNGAIYVPFGAEAFPINYFSSANPAVLGGGVVAYHVP